MYLQKLRIQTGVFLLEDYAVRVTKLLQTPTMREEDYGYSNSPGHCYSLDGQEKK